MEDKAKDKNDISMVQGQYNYIYSDKFEIEDVEERRIYINCEINENVVDSAVYHILRYNRLDKGVPIEERHPIIIYINSPGGSVTNGFSLIDAIISSKTPIITVNIGIAYSMGFLVYIAGDKRYSMPSCTYLLHDGGSFSWGFESTQKMKDRVDFEAGEMEKYIKGYILERTKIPEEEYNENLRKEWYFYPNEAKTLGVTDYIVGKDCEIDEII